MIQKPKAPGQVGFARIECLTNYYELTLGSKCSAAFFFSVKITKIDKPRDAGKKSGGAAAPPRAPKKERKLGMKLNRKVFAELPRSACGDQWLAYDGRQRACGLKRIPDGGLNLIVSFDNDDWEVTIAHEKTVSLHGLKPGGDFGRSDEEEESLLSVALMMNHMPSLSYTPLGRGFYGLPGEPPKPIGGGFDLWSGYKAHVIPGANKLYFNVNYAITAFIRPGNLEELLPELSRGAGQSATLHPAQIKELKNKLSRCRAETLHLKKTKQKKFSIATITNESASKISFTDRDGRRVTVAQYFSKEYSTLRHPDWPCVQVGYDNPRYFPLEVVKILEGNPFRGDQTPTLTSDIIKLAAIPPRNRLEEIRATVTTLRKSNELDREFDLKIGNELTVPARILPPPKLVSANNRSVRVNPGVIDFRSDQFFLGSQIKSWTVVLTDNRVSQQDVGHFVNVLMKQGASTGVHLAKPLTKTGNTFHHIDDRTAMDKVEEAIVAFGK